MDHQTIWYSTDGAIATISLNRPERLNTIVPPMPEEIAAAVDTANLYSDIKVIVLPRKKEFLDTAIKDEVGRAIHKCDEMFGDYSSAHADQKPNPNNEIAP